MISSTKRHPLDWFFFLRPTLLFPVCTVFLAGYHFGNSLLTLLDWIIFVPCAIAMGGAVYVFNEVSDVDSDRANQKLHYLAQNIFSLLTAKRYGFILTIIGLAGLAYVAKASILWVFAGFAITGVLYNVPPFRWKDRPTAGIAVALLGGGLAFWTGMLLSDADIHESVHIIPYLFAFSGVSVLTQLLDTTGDAATNKTTLAVKYGVRSAGKIGWWCVAAAFVSAVILKDYIMVVSAGVTAIIGLRLLRISDAEWGAFTARFAVLLLSVSIGRYFPVYLLTIVVYYFFARWYYRMRFQINYPSLTGTNW